MLPVLHAMSKTSIELRRAINRLKVFKDQNPTDEHVVDGSVDLLVEDLEQARRHIPKPLRDIDLTS